MKDNTTRLAVYSTLSDEAQKAKASMRPLDTGAPEEALPAGIMILITALAEEAVGRQLLNPGKGITVSHGSAQDIPLPPPPKKPPKTRKKK